MADHSKTIVSLEAWAFHSPDLLKSQSEAVDIGLLAEALIYYDRVLIDPGTERHFALLMKWFKEQGKFDDLLALIADGSIEFVYYAFFTAPIHNQVEGTYSIWNVADPIWNKPGSFLPKILYSNAVTQALERTRDRNKLYRAIEGKVIELKSEHFGPAVDNAREDFISAEKSKSAVQAFIDELYSYSALGKPPQVATSVTKSAKGTSVTFNVSFDEIAKLAGPHIQFHKSSVISAMAHSNRAIWTAAKLNCDLFQGFPLAALTRYKFSEVDLRMEKKSQIIEELQKEVEFPDIRRLVNTGKIGWDQVMEFRKKGKRFRDWLNTEGERDRNAIIAYHEEVAKECGILSAGRKSLSLFGVLGCAATSTYVGGIVGGPPGAVAGAVVGAAAGETVKYVFDVASKLNADWKPVVFGRWLKNQLKDHNS